MLTTLALGAAGGAVVAAVKPVGHPAWAQLSGNAEPEGSGRVVVDTESPRPSH
ncbi:hypothetical protein OHA40_06280 [Nocardia sp. NBC_00508]|uniref:hypothetical protein n=1 Tax=Nocardia sp. NBC_00508 TaxID=2975992 RepID=UPI002E81F021|nr:hypothetical protein [Nocardia sp. NBC_00508]WUD67733.1 hypothetical protein OHA40_06280 [Nocardia sp. NBC_00508]